jgi:putative hydrolase of the HAD superfamily
MTIRLITVDLDDTLWDCAPVIRRAEQVLYAWLQRHYPSITQRYDIDELRGRRMALMREDAGLRYDLGRLRRESLRRLAVEFGYAEQRLVDDAYEVFMEARHEVEIFEDVMPALERLSRCYAIGALTNGNASVHRLGMGHLFRVAVTAAEVGAAKPDPAMFDYACRVTGIEPMHAVHVGDHPEHDVLGARSVGMRSVWINRFGREWPDTHEPAHAQIRTLLELETLMTSWTRSARAEAAG